MRSRALLLLVALAVPSAASAQRIAELKATDARLRHELDSLRHLPKPVAPMDTLQLPGGWVVATSPELRPMVEAEAPEALAEARTRYGGLLEPGSTMIRVMYDSSKWAMLQVTVGGGAAGLSREGRGADRLRSGAVARLIATAAPWAAWTLADSGLRAWAGGDVVGQHFDDYVDAARVRLQRDTGAAVSECRNGVLSACELALGGGGRVPEFNSVVRLSLLRFALDRVGGDAALPRLYADPRSPILDRLAVLTSLPGDSLVAQWHRAVLHPDALTAGNSAIALLGALVLLAIGMKGATWRAV